MRHTVEQLAAHLQGSSEASAHGVPPLRSPAKSPAYKRHHTSGGASSASARARLFGVVAAGAAGPAAAAGSLAAASVMAAAVAASSAAAAQHQDKAKVLREVTAGVQRAIDTHQLPPHAMQQWEAHAALCMGRSARSSAASISQALQAVRQCLHSLQRQLDGRGGILSMPTPSMGAGVPPWLWVLVLLTWPPGSAKALAGQEHASPKLCSAVEADDGQLFLSVRMVNTLISMFAPEAAAQGGGAWVCDVAPWNDQQTEGRMRGGMPRQALSGTQQQQYEQALHGVAMPIKLWFGKEAAKAM